MRIEFLACKPKGHPFPILSWLIIWLQKTFYSHHAIKIGNIVYDATGKGVRFNSSWEFNSRYETIDSIEIESNVEYEALVNWCLLYVGRSYGFFQLIGIALKLTGLSRVNPFGNEDKNLICSELLILFMAEFKDLEALDSDEYDLNSTWQIAKEYRVNYGNNASYID